jgi:hypothetical protein
VLKNDISFKNLKVLTLNGEEVLNKKRNGFSLVSTTVNISALATGSYILAIETELGIVFKQIIIKK